jgi:hypothetical protein
MIEMEHSLSTPEQKAILLTRVALRNDIDASALEAAASNLRSLETLWLNSYLQSYGKPGFGSIEDYRAWRVAAIRALLDESQ